MKLIKFITIAAIICFIFTSAIITQSAQTTITGINSQPTRQSPSISLMNSSAPIDPCVPGSGGGGAGVF